MRGGAVGHQKIKTALLLARVADEISLLSETSDDLQLTVSELLPLVGSAIGSQGILTLQEMDRLSQTLKGLSELIRSISELEEDATLSANEIRVAAKLDSLADRLLGILGDDNHSDDFFWALAK